MPAMSLMPPVPSDPTQPPERDPRRVLQLVFDRALRAVHGRAAVAAALRRSPIAGGVVLIAVGKAAEAMAEGAYAVLGPRITGGLVVSKAGHLLPDKLAGMGLGAVVGGHPVPTEGSLQAGRQVLQIITGADDAATLLFLISGGTSSLLEVPVGGLGLPELERLNEWLLGSGLPIEAMNRVRKAVSRIKGGGILRYLAGRKTRVLAISDVPGDDPGVIGSGLLVPEPDLAGSLRELGLPTWLRAWVDAGLAERSESYGSGPAIELVATLSMAKRAAAEAGKGLGLAVQFHERFVEGDAAERGRDLVRQLVSGPPGLHLWGGETTVHLPERPGRGGRNTHLALAAALELAGREDCHLLSAGTDGTDGPTEDAGALVDGGTVARASLDGFDATEALRLADSGSALEASGDLIQTGPTGTNVMDLMLGLRR
jgi:glycerate 2-kinase